MFKDMDVLGLGRLMGNFLHGRVMRIFENDICENSRFSIYAKISLQVSQKVLVLTEKIKTVIGCYFLSPFFALPVS